MSGSEIHIDQFCAGFSTGDAISNAALIIQGHLRELGFRSAIYTEQFPEKDSERVLHFRHYRGRRDSVLIYHHSFFTRALRKLPETPGAKILVFHNVTPARYVAPYNRAMAASLERALEELARSRDLFTGALADSGFNARTLAGLGFANTRVMPVPVICAVDLPERIPPHLRYLRDGSVNILFVGRVFPNKRHQDLLKAFYFFQKLQPRSRLILVGPYHPGVRGYTGELFNMCKELEIQDRVVFTDMVSDEEIRVYYDSAGLFLSMSDHEGFFVPLLESMAFNVPILAYGSSVIPETLGNSGVIFYEKDYPRVAELMMILSSEQPLREKIIAAQRERLKDFSAEKSLGILDESLREILQGKFPRGPGGAGPR